MTVHAKGRCCLSFIRAKFHVVGVVGENFDLRADCQVRLPFKKDMRRTPMPETKGMTWPVELIV